jgi:adenylate kinase family enzyme
LTPSGPDTAADSGGGYPRRIAVVGCGGSGKTYVARALAAKHGLPLVHADGIVYRNGILQPETEWQAELHARADEGAWVIDAMKLSILEYRVARADTVVFLDVPRRWCYLGLLQRRARRRDVLNVQFLRWIWRFPREARPRIIELLERHRSSTDVVVLRSRREVRRYL